MKKVATLLSIILVTLMKAQAVSDYRYILVPAELSDFKENKSYGLDTILENSLKGKKYTILSENKSTWPAEALGNPCKVLTADILNDKSMFRNKIILQFKDCNNNVVLAEKGNSGIKEFEPGYKDALKLALGKIPVSNPSSKIENLADVKPQETIRPQETVKQQEAIKTVQETKPRETTSQTSTAQRYTKGNLSLQKIQIAEDQFILVDGNSSVPFATFKSTAKKDVYRVKLGSGESTIGYYENGNIIIEMPKSNGEFSNEVFTAN